MQAKREQENPRSPRGENVLRVSSTIRIGKRIVLETHQQNQLNMEMKGHNYEDGCPAFASKHHLCNVH